MGIKTRIARTLKEALGLHQWPRKPLVQPQDFEEQIYSALLRDGDLCLDVGASYGTVSLYLAKLVGPSGRVVAFEPVLPVYFELCARLQKDGYEKATVTTIPMGLSEANGTATVSVPNGRYGFGSLAVQAEWPQDPASHDVLTYDCSFTTLDSIIPRIEYPRLDFMKIDVEGAELLVLRGGAVTFERGLRPLMLIEIFAPWEQSFGYGPWDVLSFLADHGYQFLFACPTGLVEHSPTRASPFPPEYEKGYNVVAFVPQAHAERISRARHLRAKMNAAVLSMPPPPMPNRIA